MMCTILNCIVCLVLYWSVYIVSMDLAHTAQCLLVAVKCAREVRPSCSLNSPSTTEGNPRIHIWVSTQGGGNVIVMSLISLECVCMVVVYTIVSRSNVYFALKSKINLKQKQLANIHDYKTLYLSISISLN